MISSYPDALKYLYENLPMFQRVGAAAIKKDLTNTFRLCHLLGAPHKAFKSVHVAGTNGKGSTCHMLSSVLQAAGYKTGLYTSPHLREFTERIRVNGQEISRNYVVDFVNRMQPAIEEIKPSFFEITVCMAFDYFAAEQVDVAIVEVGLGGRLDSTNVISPLVSVITNISWDHMDMLGNTLPEIASEKAGIIKPNVPVVISERQAEVEHVFREAASRCHAPVHFASDRYSVLRGSGEGRLTIQRDGKVLLHDVNMPLQGLYQHRNIPGVMQTLDVLRNYFAISLTQIRQGLEGVVATTGLKGRWQIMATNPTVVCDTGHNAEGIRFVVDQLSAEHFNRLFIVLGLVKDKDVHQVLCLLPKTATYIFCQAKIPRAMDAEVLQKEASHHGLTGTVIADVNSAIQAAVAMSGAEDLIFIGGSTYVVAEINDL